MEDNLADLKADLGVVNDERDLSCSIRQYPVIRGSQWNAIPHVRSTKLMTLPVRPPIFPRAVVRPLAAPAIAGPAAVVTRDKPSFALDAVSLAASVAFWAAVLSDRRAARRRTGERSIGRASDCMVTDEGRGRGRTSRDSMSELRRVMGPRAGGQLMEEKLVGIGSEVVLREKKSSGEVARWWLAVGITGWCRRADGASPFLEPR